MDCSAAGVGRLGTGIGFVYRSVLLAGFTGCSLDPLGFSAAGAGAFLRLSCYGGFGGGRFCRLFPGKTSRRASGEIAAAGESTAEIEGRRGRERALGGFAGGHVAVSL